MPARRTLVLLALLAASASASPVGESGAQRKLSSPTYGGIGPFVERLAEGVGDIYHRFIDFVLCSSPPAIFANAVLSADTSKSLLDTLKALLLPEGYALSSALGPLNDPGALAVQTGHTHTRTSAGAVLVQCDGGNRRGQQEKERT